MGHRAVGRVLIAATMLTVALACSRGGEETSTDGAATRGAASTGTGTPSSVKVATRPATACDWIPVAEVEAILGPLAGTPVGHEDSCRYPLPLDSAAAKRRADYKAFLGPNAPGLRGIDLDKVAVVVRVDLGGDVSTERAGRMVGNMMGSMFANALGTKPSADTSAGDEPPPPEGWDVATAPVKTRDFSGRIGHVTVRVEENLPVVEAIPAEKKAALAARVRDRIPDLPFTYLRIDDAVEPAGPPTGRDPCALLTREEAESVLGKLVVAPYRSLDGGPYVDQRGTSCAYYTAGHRVLVVIPHWTDGKQELTLVRGTGNLASGLTGDQEGAAADTLDGPWDDVALGLDGRLSFLKGDRLLQLAFVTSSTDQAGALKLARIALDRLQAAP